MRLSRLFCYPVKSLAGVELQAGVVDDFGLVPDRRWLVVNADGVALTQRDLPRLALIRPALADGQLRLAAPGQPRLVAGAATGPQRAATVWADTMTAQDVGPHAAEWLSDFLGTPAPAPCRSALPPPLSATPPHGAKPTLNPHGAKRRFRAPPGACAFQGAPRASGAHVAQRATCQTSRPSTHRAC